MSAPVQPTVRMRALPPVPAPTGALISPSRSAALPEPAPLPVLERAPARVGVARALLTCTPVVAVVVGLLAVLGLPVAGLVVAGCLVVAAAFGAAFVWAGVSVAGFVAGAAAAGIVVAEPGSVLAVLFGAAVVALACGIAPGWERMEAWQAARTNRSAGEATNRPAPAGRRWWRRWRTDRAVAAYLVLVFPPGTAAAAAVLLEWMGTR
jgi:hypothetical protein